MRPPLFGPWDRVNQLVGEVTRAVADLEAEIERIQREEVSSERGAEPPPEIGQ